MTLLRLAVVGSRHYLDYQEFSRALDLLLSTWHGTVELVSGGARGADSLAERYGREHGLPVKVFPADWDQHGRAAGMIRNREIVQYCTAAVAFWDGESRGTRNSIELAKRAGKPTFVFNFKTKIRTRYNRPSG
jgi:hypothetical protein